MDQRSLSSHLSCYHDRFSLEIIEPDPEPVEDTEEVIEAAVAEEVPASHTGVWVCLTHAH